MNVSLPDELRSFVDSQVNEGSYGSTSEYVREQQAELGLVQANLRGAAERDVEDAIDDWRVLHARRDIPTFLTADPDSPVPARQNGSRGR